MRLDVSGNKLSKASLSGVWAGTKLGKIRQYEVNIAVKRRKKNAYVLKIKGSNKYSIKLFVKISLDFFCLTFILC